MGARRTREAERRREAEGEATCCTGYAARTRALDGVTAVASPCPCAGLNAWSSAGLAIGRCWRAKGVDFPNEQRRSTGAARSDLPAACDNAPPFDIHRLSGTQAPVALRGPDLGGCRADGRDPPRRVGSRRIAGAEPATAGLERIVTAKGGGWLRRKPIHGSLARGAAGECPRAGRGHEDASSVRSCDEWGHVPRTRQLEPWCHPIRPR